MVAKTLRLASLLVVLGLALVVAAPHAHAATLNVVAGTDAIDANGQCQLSEAIQNINDQAATNADCSAGDGNNDTINLPSGTVTLSGDLAEFSKSVIIQGQGKANSIIDGNNKQYSVIRIGLQSIPPFIENFEFRDASIFAAKNYGIFGYGIVNMVLSNASISDGESGVVIPSVQNISISDTEIENNIGADNSLSDIGETAGLYGQLHYTGEGPMPSFAMDNSSISNNITSNSSDISPAGVHLTIACEISNGCDGEAAAVTISHTVIDNNVSIVSDEASFAGLIVQGQYQQAVTNYLPARIQISDVDMSRNSATSPTGAAMSGFILYPLYTTENSYVNNATITSNESETSSDEVPSLAGAFGYIFSTNRLIVSNITYINNRTTLPENSLYPLGGFAFARFDLNASFGPGAEVSNSLLSGNYQNTTSLNCASSADLGAGPINIASVSLGGNISDDATCASSFTQPTDKNNVDPADLQLGILGSHGGSVPTVPLGEGSIAIDSGVTVAGLTTDARGVARPQCAAYDSGAYEYNGTCPAPQQLTYPDPEKGSTVSLVLPQDVTSPSVSAVDPDTIPKDGDSQFPAGLTTFQFTTTPGATKTVALYYDLPGNPSDYTARKYKTNTQTYLDVPNATITREDYNGKSMLKLTYSITDGGILDQDGVANGTVIDPVGLATTSLADTGESVMSYLIAIGALILTGLGLTLTLTRGRQ